MEVKTWLTKNEKQFLNAMRTNEYGDILEGAEWVYAAIDAAPMTPQVARGVMSSLTKKGYIVVFGDGEERSIDFTELGKKLFDNADGDECHWGGPKLLKVEE